VKRICFSDRRKSIALRFLLRAWYQAKRHLFLILEGTRRMSRQKCFFIKQVE
jgi:hypothetical protein